MCWAAVHATEAAKYSASPVDRATGIGRWHLWSIGPPDLNMTYPPVLLPVSTSSCQDASVKVTVNLSFSSMFAWRRVLPTGDDSLSE